MLKPQSVYFITSEAEITQLSAYRIGDSRSDADWYWKSYVLRQGQG